MEPIAVGVALAWGMLALGCWLGYQLVLQSGRLLLRLEALERQLGQGSAVGHKLPKGLPVGSVPHDFDLPALAGGQPAHAARAHEGDGRTMEDYLPERPLHRGGPEALLPPWALAIYRDVRHDLLTAPPGSHTLP